MAREYPVTLTHPGGELPDVVAGNAIDLNNFVARDGYVVADKQGEKKGNGKPDKPAAPAPKSDISDS